MKGAFSMVAILLLAGTALCAAGQGQVDFKAYARSLETVSYTHLRAHET